MANDCCGTMRVVSKSKEVIERFNKIMNYKDNEYFCHRVRGFEEIGGILKSGDYYFQDFDCDSAWSSESWFDGEDMPHELIIEGYETVNENGVKRMDYSKPIYGTAHYTTITHLAETLGFGVEMWSTEPGCCFAEHATCDSNGIWNYDTADYEMVYPEDEDGEPDYDCEPEEVNEFGDEFGEFCDCAYIYNSED